MGHGLVSASSRVHYSAFVTDGLTACGRQAHPQMRVIRNRKDWDTSNHGGKCRSCRRLVPPPILNTEPGEQK